MNNKIKIIVPFYNPGEFLETCVATAYNKVYVKNHIWRYEK